MTANGKTAGKKLPRIEDLIPLRQAAEMSGLSMSHLSLLIRKGELWGMKIGRNWVTTEKTVQEYLALGLKPGPKPRKRRTIA